MKNKIITSICIIIVCVIAVIGIYYNNQYDGSTIESRERILKKNSDIIHISSEIELDGYIISSGTTTDNKYAFVIFEPKSNGKYKCVYRTEIQTEQLYITDYKIKDKLYNFFWIKQQPNLEYAEVIYTVNNKEQEPIKIDIKGKYFFYNETPGNDYTVKVVFYDNEGNKYE